MEIRETKMNLFDLEGKGYLFAHCISADCALGAGIAKEFRKRYNMRNKLLEYQKEHTELKAWFLGEYTAFCVVIENVANLVTKLHYYGKPTYTSLRIALEDLKRYCIKNDITHLAMPKIGCGLDKLKWDNVKIIIEETFKDLEGEIIVCYI